MHDISLKRKLNDIYAGIFNVSKKITSATRFIDFFVHDILDYTILNKDEKNFNEEIKFFDVRDAINEIDEILEDKIRMKNLLV